MITSNWLRFFKSGVVALVAIVAMTAVPHAVQAATVFTDGFGTGNTDSTFNEAPVWTEGGAGAEKRASGSGNDSASPNGGRFAIVFGDNGNSEGRLCTTINATGYTNLMLSYFWRGDDDSHNPSDDGLVQYRTSGSCSDSSGWTTLKNHDMQSDSSWTTQSAFAIAPSNQSFLLRFYTDTNQDDEHFRVDGVLVTGDVVPTDVCENLEGVQETVPEGYTEDDGVCTPIVVDVCSNLEGTQTVVPEGYTEDEGVCTPVIVDVCNNIEGVQASIPEGYTETEGACFPIIVPPTDVCNNLEGVQESVPEGYTESEGICTLIDTPPTDEEICEEEGGIWNSETQTCEDPGPTDEEVCEENGGFWNGEGCEKPELTDEEQCELDGGTWNGESCDITPEQQCVADGGEWNQEEEGEVSFCIIEEEDNQDSGGGNTNMGVGNSGGSVLGAATESCEALLSTYMGENQENDATEVTELQTFLNDKESAGLTVSGIFDGPTTAAVSAFQLKYWEEVLQPWFNIPGSDITDQTDATGVVYKTTQRMVNNLHCPSLELPMPELP